MIKSLQSLRGIFAIMIYLSHFIMDADYSRAFHAGGVMGVEFFFVLSGFVMCAGYEKKADMGKIRLGQFMLRRIIRLWPFHLLCLGFYFLFFHVSLISHPLRWLADLLMLQPWVPKEAVYFSGNVPSWCLGVFMLCYLVFPFLIRFWHRNPRRFLKVFFGIWATYILYLIVLPTQPAISENMEIWLTRVFPPLRILDFTIGILLWQWYSHIREGNFRKRLHRMDSFSKTIIEIVPICLLGIASYLFTVVPDKWDSTAIWWIPAIATVSIYALFDNQGGLISRFLSWRPLVSFGNASFIFYLIHYLGIIVLQKRVYPKMGFNLSPEIGVVVDCIILILVTMILTRWLYNPMTSLLRKYLLKGHHPTPTNEPKENKIP